MTEQQMTGRGARATGRAAIRGTMGVKLAIAAAALAATLGGWAMLSAGDTTQATATTAVAAPPATARHVARVSRRAARPPAPLVMTRSSR